jgi:hypothetical protein
MELTDKQLEKVREAARTVEYGSVTINISATSSKLDLNIQRRVREEDAADHAREPGNGVVQYEKPGIGSKAKVKEKT